MRQPQFLVEGELVAFPLSGHDEMLDAISRILEEDLKVKAPVTDADSFCFVIVDSFGFVAAGGGD